MSDHRRHPPEQILCSTGRLAHLGAVRCKAPGSGGGVWTMRLGYVVSRSVGDALKAGIGAQICRNKPARRWNVDQALANADDLHRRKFRYLSHRLSGGVADFRWLRLSIPVRMRRHGLTLPVEAVGRNVSHWAYRSVKFPLSLDLFQHPQTGPTISHPQAIHSVIASMFHLRDDHCIFSINSDMHNFPCMLIVQDFVLQYR